MRPRRRALAADGRGAGQRRHHARRRSPRPRSTPARRSSTTSPPAAPIPTCSASSPTPAPGYVAMHMQGEPRTMQHDPRYDDVVAEVGDFLVDRLDAARAAGHRAGVAVADPGHRVRQDASTHNLDAARRASPSSSRASACRCSSARRARRSSAGCSASRRARGTRRRHARDRRLGARPGRRAWCGCTTSRARRAPRACSTSSMEPPRDREPAVTTLRGRWAQGLEPRFFCWIIKDRLAASERPGGFARNHRKVRRQEELIWLDRARLHARPLAARLAAQPARVRGGRASPYEHVPLGRHDELAERLPRASTARSRAGSTIPTEQVLHPPRGVRRPPARRARRLPPLRGPRRPRARTRSSSIEQITGRQLGAVGARDRRGHGRGAASSRSADGARADA